MQKFHWKCTSVTDFLCEDSDGHSIRLFIRGEYLPQSDVIVFSVLEVHLIHDNADHNVLKSDNEWCTVKRLCADEHKMHTCSFTGNFCTPIIKHTSQMAAPESMCVHFGPTRARSNPNKSPVQPNSASVTQASTLENFQPTFWWWGGNREALIT